MLKKLTTSTPLNGYEAIIGEVSLKESAPEIFSFSIPKKMQRNVNAIIKKLLKFEPLSIGQSVVNKSENIRLIRNSVDQYLILFENESEVNPIMGSLAQSFYTTEQSDAWAGVLISGKQAPLCLERICPLDLSEKAFPVGTAVRTLMEQLNVLIIKTGREDFTLFSGSSSAISFLEAIEISARNIE